MAKIVRYSLQRQTVELNEAELKHAILDYLVKHKLTLNKESKVSIIATGGHSYKEGESVEVQPTTVLLPTKVVITVLDENPEVSKVVNKKKTSSKG